MPALQAALQRRSRCNVCVIEVLPDISPNLPDSAATICAFILDIRTLHPKDRRGAYGRAVADQQGKEPLMHKNLPKGFATEETQYLRPEADGQLYDPGSNTPSAPLRSLSPAANDDGGYHPDALQAGRRTRSVSPGVSRWREME